jgi:hypothetical protein
MRPTLFAVCTIVVLAVFADAIRPRRTIPPPVPLPLVIRQLVPRVTPSPRMTGIPAVATSTTMPTATLFLKAVLWHRRPHEHEGLSLDTARE